MPGPIQYPRCPISAICTMELAGIIDWLFRCHQAGALTERETGLPLSRVGTREFLEKLLHIMTYREGFGDILAEGLVRVRGKVSDQAQGLIPPHTIGVGIGDAYWPRIFIAHSLLNTMEPRGHIPLFHHLAVIWRSWVAHVDNPDHSPVSNDVFYSAAKAFWGSEEAANVSTYEGKALAVKKTQDRMCMNDSLGLCDFTWPITYSFNTDDHVGDPALEAKIFSAVTGQAEDELYRYGETIFNLQRLILLREGRSVPDADYPAEYAFTESQTKNRMGWEMKVPGPEGEPVVAAEGPLDREKFTNILREYYGLRGWDKDTGRPRPETLKTLGLGDMTAGF